MGMQKYTAQFRESAIALVLSRGELVEPSAADLGIPPNTLRVRVSLAPEGEGVFKPRSQKDLAERVRELESENRRLRIDRDILYNATAFFATESKGGRP